VVKAWVVQVGVRAPATARAKALLRALAGSRFLLRWQRVRCFAKIHQTTKKQSARYVPAPPISVRASDLARAGLGKGQRRRSRCYQRMRRHQRVARPTRPIPDLCAKVMVCTTSSYLMSLSAAIISGSSGCLRLSSVNASPSCVRLLTLLNF